MVAETNKKPRVLWIDIARGLAILMVIIGHSQMNYYGDYWTRLLFSVHLPIFFVLSGYLYRPKAYRQELKGGWFNLILPYLATVVIGGALIIIARLIPNAYILPYRIFSLKSLLFSGLYGVNETVKIAKLSIIGIGAIWFLLAFFLGIQIFNLVMKLNIPDWGKGLISIVCTVSGISISQWVYLPWSLDSALFAQIFFFSGYLIKKSTIMTKLSWWMVVILSGIYLYSGTQGTLVVADVRDDTMLIGVVAGITNSLFLMWFSQKIEEIGKRLNIKWILTWLAFMGAESLTILCFHLIDLDYLHVWVYVYGLVYGHAGQLMATYAVIIYRIVFTIIMTLIIRNLPIFRSLYMYRRYPFIKR